ncbi:MAG: hypothetical protein IT493_16560, partial [Gammaproteobacteria bacterium]|nr:hypothetical protein [Gammaproteobacteria bacterium]
NVHVFELTNHGVMRTVTAADTLAIGLPSGISASVLINRGVVEAVNGGTVLIRNGSVKNADGLIRAQDQSIVRIAVPVVGGTLSSSGTGVVDMASGSLSNVSIQGTMRVTGMPWLDRDTSVLAGQTITNNGTIVFEPTGALGGFAVAYDQIMLDGNGEIDMGASGKGRIGCASASGAACPHRLVLGTGQLVRGSGELGASGLELVNHGRIVADRALPLTIQPSSGGMINLGIMEADGGTLRLSGATFINAGGIIRHAGASYVDLIGSGVTIAGGTLAGSGTGAVRIGAQSYLQNLTITGRVLVPANRLLSLNAGTIVNDGILRMEGSAAGNAFTRLNMGDVTLAGSGTLEMTGTQNIITSTAFAPVRTLVHGAAHTIRGGGQLGAGFLGIVNHGRILADAAATLVIDPDPVGGGLTNHGSLEAAAGATLTVTDSLTNYNATTKTLSGGRYAAYGTLRLANADIVNNAAWIDLVGPSSALLRHAGGTDALAGLAANSAGGTLKIMSGRSFTSAGDLTNAGVVTVGLGSTLNVGAAGGGTYRQTAGSTGGLGTLHAAQVQIVGGSFEPGASPGLLTVDGDLVIGPSAELLVEIGGPDKYDQLIVTGQMQLGGRLRITLVDGYQPHAPLGIQFITAAAISGEFATVELGAGIVGANLLSGASGLQLTVTPVPEPAAYLLMAAALATFGSTRRVSMRRPPSARASRQPTL